MPKKKKSNLSRYTRSAMRKKLARARGTIEYRGARIKKERNIHSETCESETYSDFESRCSQSVNTATSRSETSTEKPDKKIEIEGEEKAESIESS